jgi:hypothetical protein
MRLDVSFLPCRIEGKGESRSRLFLLSDAVQKSLVNLNMSDVIVRRMRVNVLTL